VVLTLDEIWQGWAAAKASSMKADEQTRRGQPQTLTRQQSSHAA
jgi:hypothetical protein